MPDECEPDCNHNGITDACDVRDGIYKNRGSGTFDPPQIIFLMETCGQCESQWLGLADRDSDGDLDVFVCPR